MKESDLYFCVKQLKERGWSGGMVKKWMVDADKTKVNPLFKSAAPRLLYLKSRTLKIEEQEDFIVSKEKAQNRSQVHLKISQNKKYVLVESVLKNVKLQAIHYADLRKRAINGKRKWDLERAFERGADSFNEDPEMADESHIQRWMVNYARHNLSNYDQIRVKYARKVGVHDAAEAVRMAVLQKIAETWPELRGAAENARRVS